MLSERRLARSQLANSSRRAKSTPTAENLAALADAKRRYAESALAEHIARVVDAAPPLTAEQRERLAKLLRPMPSGRDAA